MRVRAAAIILLAVTLPAASALADDAAPPRVLARAVSRDSALAASPGIIDAAFAERFAKPAGCASDRDLRGRRVRSFGEPRPIRNDDVIVLAGDDAPVVVVVTGGSRSVGFYPVGRGVACQGRQLGRPTAAVPTAWACPASPPRQVPAGAVRDSLACPHGSFVVRR